MTGSEYGSLVRKNPSSAHRALFDEYFNYVRTIVYNHLRSCGSVEDVEECISDIFASVYFGFSERESSEELKGYIGTIAKRMSIDRYRSLSVKAGKTVSIDNEDYLTLKAADDVVAGSERAELQHIVIDAVKSLGEPDSTILMQKYYYNKNSKEIGKLLDMKPATVRMRSKRAVEKLRDILSKTGIAS
ncbi:MAG: sigma-70 family RNA polymerase sigma factor [Ruminococcus sp.]|nr:sigma-70 family RNA polymerase sigma factor [Ruminococcus sp.]